MGILIIISPELVDAHVPDKIFIVDPIFVTVIVSEFRLKVSPDVSLLVLPILKDPTNVSLFSDVNVRAPPTELIDNHAVNDADHPVYDFFKLWLIN